MLNSYNPEAALSGYQHAGSRMEAEEAGPHRLIELLFERARNQLAAAKGHMVHRNVAEKAMRLGRVLDVINALRSALDHDAGGEIATNLDRLYDYMGRTLVAANINDDVAKVEEVATLLREISGAWSALEPPATTAPGA